MCRPICMCCLFNTNSIVIPACDILGSQLFFRIGLILNCKKIWSWHPTKGETKTVYGESMYLIQFWLDRYTDVVYHRQALKDILSLCIGAPFNKRAHFEEGYMAICNLAKCLYFIAIKWRHCILQLTRHLGSIFFFFFFFVQCCIGNLDGLLSLQIDNLGY